MTEASPPTQSPLACRRPVLRAEFPRPEPRPPSAISASPFGTSYPLLSKQHTARIPTRPLETKESLTGVIRRARSIVEVSTDATKFPSFIGPGCSSERAGTRVRPPRVGRLRHGAPRDAQGDGDRALAA